MTPVLAAIQPESSIVNLQENAYILGPGGMLELKIFDADKLAVLSDGTVPLPLVGSVRVVGLIL